MQSNTFTDPTSLNNEGVSGAKSRVSEMGQTAAAAFDAKRDAVARGIESAASTLHERADTLPGGERIAEAAHTAADAMDSAANYMRDQDLQAMVDDMRQMVTRHPGATLVIATALGFLLARTLSRN